MQWYAVTFMDFRDKFIYLRAVQATCAFDAANLARALLPVTVQAEASELSCWACGPTKPTLG